MPAGIERLLEELARLDRGEFAVSPSARAEFALNPPKPPPGVVPSIQDLKSSVWATTAKRRQLEKKLVALTHKELPPIGKAPDYDLSPAEKLAALEVRATNTAKAWFDWREKADPTLVYGAIFGVGDAKGATLYKAFRQARAWAGEAASELVQYNSLAQQHSKHNSIRR